MLKDKISTGELAKRVCLRYEEFFHESISINKMKMLITIIFDEIKNSINKGFAVGIKDFGVFNVFLFTARRRVDPIKKQEHYIPPKLIPNFYAADKYRRQLGNNVNLLEEVYTENSVASNEKPKNGNT
jgi:nucleoid DNA-binding protein